MKQQYLPSSSCTLKPPQVVLRLFRQVVFNLLKFIWCCWNGDHLFIKEYNDGIACICNIQEYPQFAELKIKTFWYISLHFCYLLIISMDMFLLFWQYIFEKVEVFAFQDRQYGTAAELCVILHIPQLCTTVQWKLPHRTGHWLEKNGERGEKDFIIPILFLPFFSPFAPPSLPSGCWMQFTSKSLQLSLRYLRVEIEIF